MWPDLNKGQLHQLILAWLNQILGGGGGGGGGGGREEFESSQDGGWHKKTLSPEINHVFCHPIPQFPNVTLISRV